jgi:transposase InsO family protein
MSHEYTEQLKMAGIALNRGRTGTALDNAMAESIMSTLKREITKRYTWRTRLDLELTLVTHIGWYHARRWHRSPNTRPMDRRGAAPHRVLERYNQQAAREAVAPT